MRMKLIFGIIIVTGVFLVFMIKKHTGNSASSKFNYDFQKPERLFSLNDGNQKELVISADVTKEWLESLKSKYNWNEFDEYDNLLWEYMYELFDKPIEKQAYSDYWILWNKLTREQKVFWAFLAFSGDVDNGGINQFVFNKPEFIIAVAEMWNELELEKIATDYESFLIELSGKTVKLNNTKNYLPLDSDIWKKIVSPFSNEKIELTSAMKIEDYFYDKEFRREVYEKVSIYIEKNIDRFTKIKP